MLPFSILSMLCLPFASLPSSFLSPSFPSICPFHSQTPSRSSFPFSLSHPIPFLPFPILFLPYFFNVFLLCTLSLSFCASSFPILLPSHFPSVLFLSLFFTSHHYPSIPYTFLPFPSISSPYRSFIPFSFDIFFTLILSSSFHHISHLSFLLLFFVPSLAFSSLHFPSLPSFHISSIPISCTTFDIPSISFFSPFPPFLSHFSSILAFRSLDIPSLSVPCPFLLYNFLTVSFTSFVHCPSLTFPSRFPSLLLFPFCLSLPSLSHPFLILPWSFHSFFLDTNHGSPQKELKPVMAQKFGDSSPSTTKLPLLAP